MLFFFRAHAFLAAVKGYITTSDQPARSATATDAAARGASASDQAAYGSGSEDA